MATATTTTMTTAEVTTATAMATSTTAEAVPQLLLQPQAAVPRLLLQLQAGACWATFTTDTATTMTDLPRQLLLLPAVEMPLQLHQLLLQV